MEIKIPKGIITNVFASTKSLGLLYFDMHTDFGQFSFSTRHATLSELEKVKLLPVSITGIVRGRRFDRNQNLQFENISIKVLNAAA
jgi:hypothetical protein